MLKVQQNFNSVTLENEHIYTCIYTNSMAITCYNYNFNYFLQHQVKIRMWTDYIRSSCKVLWTLCSTAFLYSIHRWNFIENWFQSILSTLELNKQKVFASTSWLNGDSKQKTVNHTVLLICQKLIYLCWWVLFATVNNS